MTKRLILAAAALVVLAIAGLVVYVQFIKADAPDRLTFTDEADGSPTTTSADAEPVETDGLWVAGTDTVVGYRVLETFAAGIQESEAAGRTSAVTGSVTLDGTTVTDAAFTADLTTVESDDPGRDRQFRGRIMDVEQFPEATFTLTEPIELDQVPPPGVETTAEATGELTLHGVTNPVTFTLRAKIVDDHVEVLADIPVVFADYDIPNPSNPFVTTHDDGTLEVLLVLVRDA